MRMNENVALTAYEEKGLPYLMMQAISFPFIFSSLSKEERLKYDEGIRKYRDTLCVMDGAYLKGIAEGREKGIAEGREKGIAEGMEKGMEKGIAEGVMQTARNLKNLGFNISDIQKATGLSEEIIKGL